MTIKKLIYAFVLPLLLFSGQLIAQERVVTGRVTDTSGGAVVNASVIVKGGKTGTQTGTDGAFSLRVPANASTLVISSVGYGSQETAIGGGTVNVTLRAANTALSEVVVIGYGTVRKKDLTGSITTITSKDFQKGTITTPEQLISGKVAGVSIISNGGAPGSGSTIRIRGGSSLNASNDPLFVIDGVPMDNGGIAGAASPLSFINPNDIESFTILKDASAAAIYGTRASNGVILITTKRGRSDKFRVNFSSVNSLAQNSKQVEVLSAEQIRSIVAEKGTATQKSQVGTANTNWQKAIYQTALTSDNNISFTGGIKKLPYRLSLGYLNQQGVLKTDLLQRGSIAFVLNPTFLDGHLKVDLNLKTSLQKYHFADQGAIGTAVYFDPTQPIYSNNKRFGGYFEWLSADGKPNTLAARNPLAMLYDRDANSNTNRSIGNLQLDYKFHFLPQLRANLNVGYDGSLGKGSTFISDSSALAYAVGGSFSEYKQKKENKLLEFYLAYATDLKSINSRFDILAGYSYNNYLTTNYSFAGYNARGVQIGASPTFPFNRPENTLLSYFGRLNYVLDEKYLLTATIRRDGSSRFGPLNKYGTFPSLALSWRINEESFLKGSKAVSDLKLRLGYGTTGQQEGINNYDFLSVYSLSSQSASYQFGNTFYQMYRPSGYNPAIKWEETTTSNIGLDYGFLNNRITGSIDVYYKKTKDLLNSVPQTAGTNFSAYQLENVGDMNNKGVEFNINTQPIRNAAVTWDVAFNVTYNKNTITNLTKVKNDPNYLGFPAGGIGGVQGFAFLNAVGGSKNTFYLYHQVYDVTGSPIEGLFEDVNRDGIINENDKYKGKRADPNVFLGFSTNLTSGKWNAGFVVRGSFNNYVYNNVYSSNGRLNTILGAQVTGNASVNYLETKFVGNTEQQPLSDFYLQNGSFLRMDNFNVGYNFGRVANNRATLRASLGVQNVFVITKYTGLDPEISSGIDNNIYPRPRIYSLGLNLDF
ncbi:SusC/RagA family TonB-linked outer membrane protein [Segetibacter aerophilus]|uniref:SusC/RagA family TonB-linked outer membrane protein n=1 Tax=Segetibacter aerophilus TaxID=670293 RepID=A0A512BCT0_9BACT|nr:SusC/RagA family TonB-linked outer membrane protein [Segetibacter aerophilus]GEO09695.1 SusC/RagA family TonB-linked outer membrane protein [Segetibacter aerophilus]